jgi:hypothetical protein
MSRVDLNNIDPRMQIEQTTFNWQKFASRYQIPPGVELDFALEHGRLGDMFVELRAYVLGNKLQSSVFKHTEIAEYDFPRSPWQFFKLRHLNAWWLRWFVQKWPVLTNVHTQDLDIELNFDVTEIHPERNYAIPRDFGRPVTVLAQPNLIDTYWTNYDS